MRKYKIDEFPQLLNIIKGDISLVGPRATVQEVINTMDKEEKNIILSVKPGLTGLGSLYDFNEGELLRDSKNPHQDYLEKIYPTIKKLEKYYIAHQSLWLDIRILWWTFLKIITKGRYKIKFIDNLVSKL